MDIRGSDKDEVIKICSDPGRVNYGCLLLRPGFYGWLVELEYTQFKPDTDANDGFHMMVCKWPDSDPIPDLTIGVVSIDKSGQPFAESILWDHGLRKVKPGYVLMTITPKGQEEFFLKGPNTFYLENHSQGAEHVVYTNDPGKIAKARASENAYAQRFFDEHLKWINTPEGKAIADAYWAKHPEGRVW